MAGYTGEKRWRRNMNSNAPESGVSETVKQLCTEMLSALNNSESAFSEMQELYSYAGGTIQDLADLLFKEDIAARKTPGTNAVLTADVDSGGSLSGVTITTAGSGYADGNYTLNVTLADGQGSNGSIDYSVVNSSITSVSVRSTGSGYTPTTSQSVVSVPLAGFVSDTAANAEEVAKTQAAFDAVTAMHELYQAANNQTVAQEDRLAQLRRMT